MARFGLVDKNDLRAIKKIYTILQNCCKTPFDGIGQPEPLKANYKGYWSRRTNLEHRIVYKAEATRIIVHLIYGIIKHNSFKKQSTRNLRVLCFLILLILAALTP